MEYGESVFTQLKSILKKSENWQPNTSFSALEQVISIHQRYDQPMFHILPSELG